MGVSASGFASGAGYGNHPSFLMMVYGNEPAGKDSEYLSKWVRLSGLFRDQQIHGGSKANEQWYEMVNNSPVLVLDGLPAELRPLVQPIDTWFENRRLALLFEARVGAGDQFNPAINLESDQVRGLFLPR